MTQLDSIYFLRAIKVIASRRMTSLDLRACDFGLIYFASGMVMPICSGYLLTRLEVVFGVSCACCYTWDRALFSNAKVRKTRQKFTKPSSDSICALPRCAVNSEKMPMLKIH